MRKQAMVQAVIAHIRLVVEGGDISRKVIYTSSSLSQFLRLQSVLTGASFFRHGPRPYLFSTAWSRKKSAKAGPRSSAAGNKTTVTKEIRRKG